MDGNYQVNKKKDVRPLEWATQSCEEPWKESFKSVHFDRFKEYREENLKGLALLDYACSVLIEIGRFVDSIVDKDFKPLIHLPLGFSKKIKKWHEKNWDNLGKCHEPPSLYILTIKDVFDLYVEEYKYPLKVSFPSEFSILAIFRCSRSLEDLWDFSSGIYLYRKGDF